MLNTKDVKDELIQLILNNEKYSYVIGKGVLIDTVIAFNDRKLEESKQKIATILQEIGVDEKTMINLSSLTTLKNGEVWNPLESMEDFEALELLLACSDACGFIQNDAGTLHRNIIEIGEINSFLIAKDGRILIGDDDKWLQHIRDNVIDNMYFSASPETIKLATDDDQELTESSKQLYILR